MIAAAILVLGLYSAALFVMGAYAHKTAYIGKIKLALLANYKIPYQYTEGLLSNPEKITIDIKHKNFQKLAYFRKKALQQGNIATTEDSYVPAKITVGSKTVKADVRLKGDDIDHVQGDKWSLRIKIKGEESLFGMSRFSLQDPKVSGYIYEWLLHRLFAQEGLIALRYDFVDVTINGTHKGIYTLEESFSKELIEHNQRREGPILKFDESGLWDGSRDNSGVAQSLADIYFCSDIDSFRTKKVLQSESLQNEYRAAQQLLENFRSKTRKPSEVFDIKKLAILYALGSMTDANHGLLWKNVRYYYNPITAKLEVIGYNAYNYFTLWLNPMHKLNWVDNYEYEDFIPAYHNLIFQDPEFIDGYVKALDRISKEEYLDTFFVSIQKELDEKLAILHREYPGFVFDQKNFYINQPFIRNMIHPSIPAKARIQWTPAQGPDPNEYLTILAANTGFMPIQVVSILDTESNTTYPLQANTVPGKKPAQPLAYVPLQFEEHIPPIRKDKIGNNLTFNYRVIGMNQMLSSNVDAPPLDISDMPLVTNGNWEETLSEHNMLERGQPDNTLIIRPGQWEISQNLVIPAGCTVVGSPGVTLNLLNFAKIISYAPIRWEGNENNPIVIESTDSTGQGLVVISAGQESKLSYVLFRNLSNPDQNAWKLTGSVTFYESPVTISHCQFMQNHSEDCLNIIRSDFHIEHTLFNGTFADAFDADFGKGKITGSTFTNCGNDAIDVSGTLLELADIRINSAGDKGISAGEDSGITACRINIENAEIAVACKDTSRITINDIQLSRCRIGFTPYQKKSEFGPASITVNRLKTDHIDRPFLIEENSTMILDNTPLLSNHKNVKDMLYGVEYGKSSR